MSKLRIITENYADAALLSASPLMPTGIDINNLTKVSRSSIIRTNAYSEPDSTQDILGNMYPDRSISAIVLGRHNLPAGTDIQIQLYSALDQTTLIHDSGIITLTSDEAGSDIVAWGSYILGGVPWGLDNLDVLYAPKANFVYWLSTTVTSVQSFKISIVVPEYEAEIGRLFIGEYISPTYTLSKGHKLTWVEKTKQYRTEGGTLRSDSDIPSRKLEFDISTMTEADRSELQNGLRYVGKRKDLFISLFPDDVLSYKEKDYSGIMKLTKIPSMQEFVTGYYKSKYVMEEV